MPPALRRGAGLLLGRRHLGHKAVPGVVVHDGKTGMDVGAATVRVVKLGMGKRRNGRYGALWLPLAMGSAGRCLTSCRVAEVTAYRFSGGQYYNSQVLFRPGGLAPYYGRGFWTRAGGFECAWSPWVTSAATY
jgi:hypothetical protein